MKTLTILSVVMIIFLTSCGADYEIKNNKVYLTGSNEGSGFYERLIEKADATTFEKISNEENILLGKDANHIFYQDSLIGIQPKSFKRIGPYFYKDNNSVYFFGFVHSGRSTWTLDKVDQHSFRIFNLYPWARDHKYLIYGDLLIEVKHLNTFKPIDEFWGKTEFEVIHKGTVFDSVDMKTFQIIDEDRAKDRNCRYEFGKRIK